jgi:hypothetical protein
MAMVSSSLDLVLQFKAALLLRDRQLTRPVSSYGLALVAQCTGTGGAVCNGATPSVEQPGGRGFKPRLRYLLD